MDMDMRAIAQRPALDTGMTLWQWAVSGKRFTTLFFCPELQGTVVWNNRRKCYIIGKTVEGDTTTITNIDSISKAARLIGGEVAPTAIKGTTHVMEYAENHA